MAWPDLMLRIFEVDVVRESKNYIWIETTSANPTPVIEKTAKCSSNTFYFPTKEEAEAALRRYTNNRVALARIELQVALRERTAVWSAYPPKRKTENNETN